ncbi:MAG: hypothetical protein K9I85_09100 [Saprospiraceae bacterium]|nr:hypothetical protein [Saprospiraceae bacterium]
MILFLLTGGTVLAQGIQTEFGKNRVQYSRDFDEWLQYESQNFITYWYGEGRMVGQAAVMIAEEEHDEIQQLLEHRMNDKIEILVYTDLTDLKQSNIGTEEAFTNVTGKTKIYGNKIFVYFNGDHQHLRKQIREGIAEVYLDAMLFGGNLQEYVQNAILFNMPVWFKEGLIAYIGEEWNSDADDRLRALLQQERIKTFDDVVKEDPELAGHAFWYYLSRQFGRSSVANILYIARIYRDVEEGMLYVLGTPFSGLSTGWYSFFQERYTADLAGLGTPSEDIVPLRNRRQIPVFHVRVSPDGRQLAYVLNRDGKIKVYVQDLQTGDRKKVMQYAFRNPFQETDYQYPLIDWHPSSQYLAILSEKRDHLQLTIKDLLKGEDEVQDLAPIYQRVYSMRYFDTQRLLFSAATGGLSDLFLYHIPTRQSDRITQDAWDDLEPAPFSYNGKRGVLFSSNRPNGSMAREKLENVNPTGTLDLYFYDLETRPSQAVRITNTPRTNERLPIQLDTTWFAWLTDESGVYNRKIAYLDSVLIRTDQAFPLPDGEVLIVHQDSLPTFLPPEQVDSSWAVPVYEIQAFAHTTTNKRTHVLDHTLAPRTQMLYDLQLVDQKFQISYSELNRDTTVKPFMTAFARPVARKPVRAPASDIPQLFHPRKDTVIQYFQTPFRYPPQVLPETTPTPDLVLEEGPSFVLPDTRELIQAPDTAESRSQRFVTSRIIPSRLKFRLDYLTNRFDNSLLFGGLDNYTGRQFLNLDEGSSRYTPPATGLLIKADVKDLLEDYEFEGGMRLPTNFRGSEFFLTFMDKKHRWDKHYSIYRGDWSNIFELNNNVLNGPVHLIPPGLGAPGSPSQYKVRLQTTLGQVQLRYPLDIFQSLRFRGTLRNDRYFWHALEHSTLAFPAVNEQRLGLRAEYVFDNTLAVAPNILNGMRYNIFTEVVKGFQIQADPFAFDLNQGFMGMAGVDFRYYLPILKHSVFAVRLNGVTSFGQERILFYLGGVDNWLLPQFNENIPINNTNYGFQTLAANLRGFQYNIRNGSSFVLANMELRVPFVKYIFPRTRSSFFRNLQVTGFFDMGTAWEGLSPYSDDNPLNIIYIENPPAVQVKLKYFRDPLVAGYGFGARTLVFGYMVKLDYAWGIETRQVQDPILYLSIGSDF